MILKNENFYDTYSALDLDRNKFKGTLMQFWKSPYMFMFK